MWWREIKRCWAVMRSIQQDIPPFVKQRPDAGHRLGPLPPVVTGERRPSTTVPVAVGTGPRTT
jgi:hypothetical protein